MAKKKISLLKKKYVNVFSELLEKCLLTKASIHQRPEAKPIHFNPRAIPFAIKQKVQDEFNRLVCVVCYVRLIIQSGQHLSWWQRNQMEKFEYVGTLKL